MPFDLKTAIAGHVGMFHGVEETLTLSRKHPTQSNVTNVTGLRRQMTLSKKALLQGSLGVDLDGTVFHIAEATLGGAKIDNGDQLTDGDGGVFTVQQVTYSHLTSRYACACSRAR